MKSIAIYGSRRQSPYFEDLQRLFYKLEDENYRLFIHESFYNYLNEEGVSTATAIPVKHFPPNISLVLSFGGDGTLLRCAKWLAGNEVPVLGINTGHLGYLTAGGLDDALSLVRKFYSNDVKIERRMLLMAEPGELPGDAWPYALNEMTVRRDESASVIIVKASVDGIPLAEYMADGLIVATPTGSTAYNLSAGGPILEPSVDCMVVTPIAPHTLTIRSLVVAADSEIELEAFCRSGKFKLTLDDRTYTVNSGDIVRIKKAPFKIALVKDKNSNFAELLRNKLLWNANTSIHNIDKET